MGVIERRARDKEALRAKILDATSRLMVNEGLESVSIRRIAEQIEYSPATIYLYFKDKAELIDAICEELFGQMIEVLGAATANEADPLKRFRKGLRAYVEFGISHPNHYLAVFGVPMHAKEPTPPSDSSESHRLGLEAFEILRRVIAGCIDQGVLPPGDLDTTSHAAWMCMHGITSLMITTYGGPCPVFPGINPARREHLIDAALEVLVAGLQNSALAPLPAL